MSATSPLAVGGRGVAAASRAATARALPTARTGEAPPQRQLQVLPGGAQRAARAPFVLLVVAVLAGGLLGLLRLNIALAADALTLSDLKHTNTTLTDQVQALDQRLDVEASPARLAARASTLGMVPNPNPAFIRLSDGRVLGSPTPGAKPAPAPAPSAPAVKAGSSKASDKTNGSAGKNGTSKNGKGSNSKASTSKAGNGKATSTKTGTSGTANGGGNKAGTTQAQPQH